MHTTESGRTAEMILRQRWRELKECQQQAEADECQMAEAVLLPQPGARTLAGDLSLTELADFVSSGTGLVGQYEQALHQFAVMSFRWAVRNLMAAAQTEDAGLRDTHRQLANWYADRSAKLTHELQQFRRVTSKLTCDSDCAASQPVDSSSLFGSTVAMGAAFPFEAMSVFAAPTAAPDSDMADAGAMPSPPTGFAVHEPQPAEEPLSEPVRSVLLPVRNRRR